MKYVALGDLHFGWDKKFLPQGRLQIKPVHEIKAFAAVLKFINEFKPDKILLMGDNFDMQPVSRHILELPKKTEGQRLVEMYEKGYDFFLRPLLNNKTEIHWFDGNHEAWAYQLADRFPGIDGMIDPYSYLELKNKNVIFHPQGDIYKIGKLAFTHGDCLVPGSVTYAARRAVERYGSSIRIWHFHTYQVYTRETLKNLAFQTGMVVPCLCNRGPSYKELHLNSWVHGFNFGYIESNGDFHDYTPIIWKGRFNFAGKDYCG